MEILAIVGILWIAGFIRELAFVHRAMDERNIRYPSSGVKYIMPFVIFFAWPYFYFLGRS